MLHRLTIGHLDPAAVERRQTVPTKALEMDVVHRLLVEFLVNDKMAQAPRGDHGNALSAGPALDVRGASNHAGIAEGLC